MSVETAAVIGSGVMGGGIAAQIANAGVSVLLLDIVPPDATNRSVLAQTALERLGKANPAAFMSRAELSACCLLNRLPPMPLRIITELRTPAALIFSSAASDEA